MTPFAFSNVEMDGRGSSGESFPYSVPGRPRSDTLDPGIFLNWEYEGER